MVDGYRNYFAVAEWWVFSTPFTQWFTKSFASVALPFSQDLSLSCGHVSFLQLKLCFGGPVVACSSLDLFPNRYIPILTY